MVNSDFLDFFLKSWDDYALCENVSGSEGSFLNLVSNPLSANPEKWSNTRKQIVGNLPTICLSVFDHFMNLALKGLMLCKFKGSN